MDHVDLLDDRGAVVRDGHLVRAVHDQLVHASRTERGANGISNSLARIDVADQLALALLTFGSIGEQDDRTSLLDGRWTGGETVRVNAVWVEKRGVIRMRFEIRFRLSLKINKRESAWSADRAAITHHFEMILI